MTTKLTFRITLSDKEAERLTASYEDMQKVVESLVRGEAFAVLKPAEYHGKPFPEGELRAEMYKLMGRFQHGVPLDGMSRRKPIQIVALNTNEEKYDILYALCDDGTIWFFDENLKGDLADWTHIDVSTMRETAL